MLSKSYLAQDLAQEDKDIPNTTNESSEILPVLQSRKATTNKRILEKILRSHSVET